MANELIQWDKIRTIIETSKDIEVLTAIKNKLRAYQVLAEQSKQSMEVQVKIAIYKARADRKCGEWLKDNINAGNPQLSKDTTIRLKDLKVTRDESSRLQKIADIPEKKFESILQEAEIETRKITNNMLVNIAKEAERKKRDNQPKPELPEGKYGVIYADPPWQYEAVQQIEGKITSAAKHHYSTMSIEQLCELKVCDLADNDCVLFIWTTSPLLEKCFPVINTWGFSYRASFVWDKIKHNVGHYNSVRHEFLLIATKGKGTPENVKLFDSVQSIEKTKKHSEKPEEFREIINILYPKRKKIELFARVKKEGWNQWGNEI